VWEPRRTNRYARRGGDRRGSRPSGDAAGTGEGGRAKCEEGGAADGMSGQPPAGRELASGWRGVSQEGVGEAEAGGVPDWLRIYYGGMLCVHLRL